MDMEITEEFVGSSTEKDMTQIAKGKRTKRQRPFSPDGIEIATTNYTTTMTTSTSSSASAGGGGGDYGSFSSPTISYESTEEEEDMANCLMLLAQGDGPKQFDNNKVQKFSSRRFADIATTVTSTKTCFYVYECKTCNRTFPSFQALGGHRASHKRPKTAAEEKKPPTPPPPSSTNMDDLEESRKTQIRFSPQISIQLLGGNKVLNSSNKVKIHECSICGSEFSSGQALGGHMRRHRAATSTGHPGHHGHHGHQMVGMNIDTSAPATATTMEIKPRNILQLDLNLPAPEDDHRDSKFEFNPTKQSMVLSAPALVDCHY